jgi:hypothetical protein
VEDQLYDQVCDKSDFYYEQLSFKKLDLNLENNGNKRIALIMGHLTGEFGLDSLQQKHFWPESETSFSRRNQPKDESHKLERSSHQFDF